MSIESFFSEYLPKAIEDNPYIAKRINSVIGFELLGENKAWTIDLKGKPNISAGLSSDLNCQIITDRQTITELMKQEKIKPWLDAYKSKRIDVKGNLTTVFRLEKLLKDFIA